MDWRHERLRVFFEASNLSLKLLNRYNNRREVVGTCDEKDTMMQRSNQLLLTPENDHFEGSMLLKAKEGIMSR